MLKKFNKIISILDKAVIKDWWNNCSMYKLLCFIW